MNSINKVKKGQLRSGYTTGSCAAAAAKAAALMLFGKKEVEKVSLRTPGGVILELPILNIEHTTRSVRCAVKKDSGDDPDVTNGILVYAVVGFKEELGIDVDGGVGVGRVTKKGLSQKIGEAAINKVPREMILNEVRSVCNQYKYSGGVDILIEIPEGVEIAKKTFNERLGIVGGLSILGTSGIVEPMSEKALLDSIRLEIHCKKANGNQVLLLTPGNYGVDFIKNSLHLDIDKAVKCSNYIGESLDYACEEGYEKILLVGHVGKLAKVAAGVMNTHSSYADGRHEVFIANAALEGVDIKGLQEIEEAVTTDEMINVLKKYDKLDDVMNRIVDKIITHISHRIGNGVNIQVVIYSLDAGLLGMSAGAKLLICQL